jgi:CheY-like chemotaxis protein
MACIIQDVVMPSGGDGLDLLECVQADKRWRHIPVVSTHSYCNASVLAGAIAHVPTSTDCINR